MDTPYRKIVLDGLWHNNPGLVQLLGLCPLLAVSNSAINALSLGAATILVMMGTNAAISFIRHWVRAEIRLPIYVMVIASIVTAVELAMNAFMHDIYQVLGIFVALITTNCIVIARAESFASKHNVARSVVDGFMMGLGGALVLFVLGSLREIIGHGTWFAGAEKVFGASAHFLSLKMVENYDGVLLAILPPGAFILLGFIIAIKKSIDKRQQLAAASARKKQVPADSQPIAT